MTPDAIARQWFKEVWDEGREEAIDRLMHPDGLAHGLGAEAIRGPEQFKPFFRMFQEALGDLAIEIKHVVTEGDMVAVHCHVVARHIGDSLGARATGRPLDFWGMSMLRVKDGQIIEGWNCFDFLSFYQQLGWVKNPPLP